MAKHKVVITGIDTSKIKVLKGKETLELLQEYQNSNNQDVFNNLVNGNLKLVLSIVQKFSSRYDNLDDLFQIGTIGLIKAINNFDITQPVRFSTYAVPMIIGEIKRFLRDNTTLRISRQVKDLAYQTLKIKEDYIRKHGNEPTIQELAQLLDTKEYFIREAIDSIQPINSLSDPIYNDSGDSFSISDQIPEDDEELSTKIINQLTLQKGMDILTETQRKVINDRYYNDKTQLEIALEFGISQAQVSRIEKNALEVLRSLF